MLSKSEQETISVVYERFCQLETNALKWTKMDECLCLLDWLTDPEIIVEAAISVQTQSKGQPRCVVNHPIERCSVPHIIDAVGYILKIYGDTQTLDEKNRFLISYYLALSHNKHIIY